MLAIPSKSHQDVAASLSNSYERTLNNCGKNHQDDAAIPSKYDCEVAANVSMADKDNGNSEEESPENVQNSCETLANDDRAAVKKEPAQQDTRHMNRKQRRAAEQYRKRLAEKEEKLRILLHS